MILNKIQMKLGETQIPCNHGIKSMERAKFGEIPILSISRSILQFTFDQNGLVKKGGNRSWNGLARERHFSCIVICSNMAHGCKQLDRNAKLLWLWNLQLHRYIMKA